ncbi:MAG: putative Ig domain-containing protein [Myxococcota bacterium]
MPLTWSLVDGPLGITLGSSGEVRWDANANDFGSHPVRIRVTDPFGHTGDQDFVLTVSFGNRAPVFDTMPLTQSTADDPYGYAATATDPDGDSPLTWSLPTAPAGMAVSPAGVASWSPTEADVGSHPVTLRVADPSGAFAEQNYVLVIVTGQEPPTFVTTPTFTASPGTLYSYDAEATDPDPGDSVTYSLDLAPSGMTVDPSSGLVSWTPAHAQIGNNTVRLLATDTTSRVAIQEFVIAVGGTNDPPVIVSTPVFEAIPDALYTYTIVADDPENDPVSYGLVSGPSGMSVDPISGVVSWNPTASDLGTTPVTVSATDSLGASATQSYALRVATNIAPRFTSAPVENGTQGELYTYEPIAVDPDPGDTVTFVLQEGPTGLFFEPVSGALRWTPTPNDVGVHPVNIAAVDSAGLADVQLFSITVANVNDGPRIVSSPVRSATVGAPYVYDVDAQDPDPLDAVTYSLVTAPPGMTIDSGNGLIQWIPGTIGSESVEVRADDSTGLFDTQAFLLDVGADDAGPTVTLTASPRTVATPGSSVLTVTASDDVGIATTTLTVDGVALPLSAGTATYTTTVTGPHLAVAQATDVNGNLGQASLTLGVTDSADTTPPTVDLESPAEDDVLTYLHDVVGTVEDDNLLGYTVSLRRTNEDTFVEVFGGATTVTSDVLGVLDTTLLENGYYELRLRAEDVNGLTAEDSVRIRVDGQAKVGVVELSFVDMAVNMVGIPLTVVRSYDSRRKDVGDFGYGWELEIQEGYVTHNRPIGEGFGITEGPPPLALPCQETPEAASHFTEVRISDREVYIFRPVVTNLARLSGACIGDVFYELVDGTLDGAELRILGENQVEYQEGTFSLIGLTSRVLFDPADVELLTPDGRLFHVNTDTGITFLSDGSGNNLQIRPEGIFHSDGASLQIERDAEGRIERIRDPMQHVVEYQYDAAGDLVGVVDVLGGVTQFLYEEPSFPHHLTTIIDRRGNRVAAMDYDGEGRLQELCDAEAACTTNSYDLSARTQVTTDATSRPVTYTYDVRGNVTQEVDGLGNVTTRTYDVHGNELTVTDPEGNVTTRTYDPVFQLSLTSETTPVPAGRDPADYTTTWTYESNGRRKTVTYPSGGGLEWDYLSNVFPPIRLRDDAGNVIWERTLGALGIPLTHTDRFGTETYEYTRSFAVPSRVTDTFGNVTDIEVDGNHNITQMTRTFDGNPLVSTFTYDPAGRRTSADYGNGLTVAYQYGLENDWTQISGPTFGTVQREYSSTGRLSAWTMPNGDQGSRLYDGAGRVLEEVDEVGNLTRSSYDAAGRLASTYDQALDATTTFERDDAGKLTARVDAESHRTEFTWDANELRQTRDARGELTTFGTTPTQQTTTDPLLRTTTRNLTPLGLPASTVFPGGGTVTPTYLGTTAVDESSRFLQTWTDEESRVRTLGYDTRSGLTSATFLGRTEAWTYRYADTLRGEITFDIESGTVGLENSDARQEPYRFSGGSEDLPAPPELGERLRTRQLDRIVTPSGEITEHTFDVQGRRTSTSYPNGSTGSWAYGSDGDVDLQTWPSGDTLNFTHDAAGNELSRTAGTGETRSVTYGPTSRIDQVVGPTGTIDYTYDAAGRVTTVSTPAGGSVESDVQYAYDDLGQITEVTVVVGASRYTTTYQYDPIGNITQITDPLGGITTQVFDAAGRRTSRTLPNGVVTTWTYDDRDRITGVDHTHPPTTSTLASRSYTRTLSGEPTRIDREDGSYIEVTYDSANRIEREIHRNPSGTIVTEKSYTYDIDGNRVSKTVDGVTESYIYDPGAELVRIEVGGAATETFTYDNGGRTTAIARPGQNYALAYDPLFTNDGGGVTAIADGTTTTDYAFDGEGRRERVDNGTTERRYLIAPSPGAGYESVHAVLDELNALVMAYVYIDDQPLLRFDSAGNATYYLEDAMGSIVGLAGATGASTAVFHYDAFGNLLASSGSASTLLTSTLGDFRFHAMWLDPTELYYVRARTYDPQTGRFLTWDSAPSLRLDPETIRGFDFARFNPFVWLDPSGRTSLPDIGAAQSAQRSLQSTATAVFRAQLTIARATANSLRGTRFVGLARNQVFSTLTRQAVRNAFTRIGLRPSNHFIARVFHPRTRALGVNSLRGIETILRRGVLVESHSGAYAVVHRGLAIVFDPKTRILITLTPWTF